MTDALGNNIKIGAIYGYSSNQNGIVNVIIGKAIELKETGVQLEIIKRGSTAYDGDVRENKVNRRTSIVKSNTLFRLENADDKWLRNAVKNKLKN